MTRVTGMTRVVIDSSQSQFKAFTMETRVKSSFFRISTRVKVQKMRLESTRVRVTDLTKLGVSAHIYARIMSTEREAKTCVRV